MIPSPTLQTLRRRTRVVHVRLERRLRLTRQPDRASYAGYLRRMLALVVVVEGRLAASPALDCVLPDVAARAGKSAALRADLGDLGVSAGSAELPVLPVTEDAPALLGMLYVFEGATLGGVGLARDLEARLGALPTRYLRYYGDAVGERWRTFCASLDRGVNPSERERVAGVAEQVFETVEQWLDRGDLLSKDEEPWTNHPGEMSRRA